MRFRRGRRLPIESDEELRELWNEMRAIEASPNVTSIRIREFRAKVREQERLLGLEPGSLSKNIR